MSPGKVKEVVGEHYNVSNTELLDRENIRPEVKRARTAAILLLLKVAGLDRGKIQDELFCSISEIREAERLEKEDELFHIEVSSLEYVLSTGTTGHSKTEEESVWTPQAELKKRPVPEIRAIPFDLPRIVGKAKALPQLPQKDPAVAQKRRYMRAYPRIK